MHRIIEAAFFLVFLCSDCIRTCLDGALCVPAATSKIRHPYYVMFEAEETLTISELNLTCDSKSTQTQNSRESILLSSDPTDYMFNIYTFIMFNMYTFNQNTFPQIPQKFHKSSTKFQNKKCSNKGSGEVLLCRCPYLMKLFKPQYVYLLALRTTVMCFGGLLILILAEGPSPSSLGQTDIFAQVTAMLFVLSYQCCKNINVK